MAADQPLNTTNKIPSTNRFDVEVERVRSEERLKLKKEELEIKKIDLEISKSDGQWNVIKSLIQFGLGGFFTCAGVIVPAVLSWKGDLKITIPSGWCWYFLVSILFLLFIVIIILLPAWYLERRGKKRAIERKEHYQKIVESSDTYRSSSCLTKQGDTPKERK